jgi:hypothetical protein
LLLAAMFAVGPACRAVMFKSTGDPTYNTTAPGGSLSNSGWQWEGNWDRFLGTPIAPRFFLSAAHVNNNDTNWVFYLGGFAYHPVAWHQDPASDLIVWETAETFPSYAPLFTGTNEVGQHCVVFGRGTDRGNSIVVSNELKGWTWAGGSTERWGENDVASTETDSQYGQLLRCTFDRTGGSNECHLSDGDSGGAMFIQDAGVWKLAGIHLAVDGPFSSDGTTNTRFNAALLDMGGFYVENDNTGTNWTLIASQTNDVPSSFYSTRIAARVPWILSVIDFLPGNDLGITGIQPVTNDVQISFVTGTNKSYRVDWCADLTTNAWTALTNVVGSGGVMTATDAGAASLARRFYRLVLTP